MSPDDKRRIEALKYGNELPGFDKHKDGTITLFYPFDETAGYSVEQLRRALAARIETALGSGGSPRNQPEVRHGKPSLGVDLDMNASAMFETLYREVLKEEAFGVDVSGAAR